MENECFITFNNEQSSLTFPPGRDIKEIIKYLFRGKKQIGNRERDGQTDSSSQNLKANISLLLNNLVQSYWAGDS